MTPDVIYPMRKFVFRAIRHSPAISVVLTNRRPPRIIARPRETDHPTRSHRLLLHPFSFFSSPSGCFAFLSGTTLKLMIENPAGLRHGYFTLEFSDEWIMRSRTSGNDFLFRELFELDVIFHTARVQRYDKRRFWNFHGFLSPDVAREKGIFLDSC